MMRKIWSWLFVLLILVPLLSALACASSNGGPDVALETATQTYRAEAFRYKAAGDEIYAAKAEGKMTQAQWTQFQIAAANVRSADGQVNASLAEWQASHVKPPNYDALAGLLKLAQDKVVVMAAGVPK